jgi:hydrogenase maturation factor
VGHAIGLVDPEEAARTLELFAQLESAQMESAQLESAQKQSGTAGESLP